MELFSIRIQRTFQLVSTPIYPSQGIFEFYRMLADIALMLFL